MGFHVLLAVFQPSLFCLMFFAANLATTPRRVYFQRERVLKTRCIVIVVILEVITNIKLIST